MDAGSLIIVCLIAAWGAIEFHRREQNHKARLDLLARGGWVSPRPARPAVWKLLGEGLVAVLLAAASALMAVAGFRTVASRVILFAMGTLLLAMAVIVCLMLLRDARHRSASGGDSR